MIKTLTDTVHKTVTIIDTVKTSSASSLDLISKVDVFYNNAWTKLIFAFTIIGIVFPLIIQWYQREASRKQSKKLTKNIKSNVSSLQTEINNNVSLLEKQISNSEIRLKKDIIKEFDKKLKELKIQSNNSLDELQKNSSLVISAVQFSLQATIASSAGQFNRAIYNYLMCLESALDLGNTDNVKIITNFLITEINKTTKSTLDEFLVTRMTFKDLIKQLEKSKNYEDYKNEIESIANAYHALN